MTSTLTAAGAAGSAATNEIDQHDAVEREE